MDPAVTRAASNGADHVANGSSSIFDCLGLLWVWGVVNDNPIRTPIYPQRTMVVSIFFSIIPLKPRITLIFMMTWDLVRGVWDEELRMQSLMAGCNSYRLGQWGLGVGGIDNVSCPWQVSATIGPGSDYSNPDPDD